MDQKELKGVEKEVKNGYTYKRIIVKNYTDNELIEEYNVFYQINILLFEKLNFYNQRKYNLQRKGEW